MDVKTHKAWINRLVLLRRELKLDQEKMGGLLGVTREWISRLETGKGEFSDYIKLRIEQLEKAESPHIAVHEDHDSSGAIDASALRLQITQHNAELLSAAGDDIPRLGWIQVQQREHLAVPSNWRSNEELNRRARAAAEREVGRLPALAPRDPPAERNSA